MNETLKWLKSIGGVEAINKINKEKAALLYGEIDRNPLFVGTAAKEDRSIMNVCFVMAPGYEDLQDEFMAFAKERGMIGIKGHRSVGGFRASIYNACPIESVQALVDCMKELKIANIQKVMKILVATEKPFAAAAVNGIREIATAAGHELALLEKYTEKSQFLEAVADADALIVRSDKVTAEVIAAAPKLKIVVRAGAGYDNLDLAACTQRGIVAMNTPGQNSNAVAELAIAMMIFMSRNRFTPGTGCEIQGKTLGIQAYGNVGRLVAAKAMALGMKVMAFDPFVPAEKMQEEGVTPAQSLEQMYESCDFISLHIPATPQTVGSIGYDLVSRMPKGGCLVNTARKEVINEPELAKVLEERQDLKYVTDVAAATQAELDEKFGKRVFATPKKMGAETAEANVNAGLAAARQIVAYFADGCTRFQLNK